MNHIRELTFSTAGVAASDGAGVSMTRLINTNELNMLDPFLLLDAFGSDKPGDYIAGFPSHPHRGFETVTYMLAGNMRHKDNAGNEGVISANGVQWMTAGKGVVHSEMPEQEQGLLKGLQLWVNLPKAHKMTNPQYQEYTEKQIPVEHFNNGSMIRVIAGKTNAGSKGVIKNDFVKPTYLDVSLKAGETFTQSLNPSDNTLVFMIDGDAQIGTNLADLPQDNLGILSKGSNVVIKTKVDDIRFVLISALPLNEPVVRGGPFVMNSKEEIQQAFADYKNKQF